MIALIDYVIAVEKDKLKPVTDVADHKGFHRTHDELRGLPGVTLNRVDGDDVVWLHVDRLTRLRPPTPVAKMLAAWIVLIDTPGREPTLRSSLSAPEMVQAGMPADPSKASIAFKDFDLADGVSSELTAYTAGPWLTWSKTEEARRKSIALYGELFTLRQAVAVVDGAPTELVCGLGYAALMRQRRLRYSLLTVPMEIELDTHSRALAVRPREEARVGVEADPLDIMGLNNVDEWRAKSQSVINGLDDSPLSPFSLESYAGVLHQATALLDPNARYVAVLGSHAETPIPGRDLIISDAFGFFQRDRRATTLIDDLAAFRALVESGDPVMEIPAAIRALFTDPSPDAPNETFPLFRGVSNIGGVTSSDGSGQDLFFPKPFNTEQAQIVQRLAVRDGVVVQGPPGTGKTHTIANIISHYLASGKRVLVTSQKSPALRVLRDQLPEAVRPLAISLLDSDREGLKQFQASVDTISNRLQRQRREDLQRQIDELGSRIDRLHRHLAEIDREVDTIGRAALENISLDGREVHPLAAAQDVAQYYESAAWLDDAIDERPEHDLHLSDEDYARLREARRTVGADLAYLEAPAPSPELLSDRDAILTAHADLMAAAAITNEIKTGDVAALRDLGADTILRLQEVELRLAVWEAARLRLLEANIPWQVALLTTSNLHSDPLIVALHELKVDADFVEVDDSYFISRPIALPDDLDNDAKLFEAISAKAQGRSWSSAIGDLFSGKTKARLAQVRLRGRAPASPVEWADIARFVSAQRRASQLAHSWNHAVQGRGLPTITPGSMTAGHQAVGLLKDIGHIEAIQTEANFIWKTTHDLLPSWVGVLNNDQSIGSLRRDLRKHLKVSQIGPSRDLRSRVIAQLRGSTHDIAQQLTTTFQDELGDRAISEEAMRIKIDGFTARLQALALFESSFGIIRQVTSIIAESGAPLWARRLRGEPPAYVDALLPQDWRQRWRNRRLLSCLQRSDQHGRLRSLYQSRLSVEGDMRHAYEQSIEARTWLELKKKASQSALTALAAYAAAVGKIGRGTGKSANRYRRDARLAANAAKGALPCWIMPHYRVSESLPPELGAFDLVIVDEASQSTLASLPALLRARQILVVGDDKQVSPDNVGRELARADVLAARHLSEQVTLHRSVMREESSLYDLASVIFGADKLMLREHFRCAAPLIEFSKQQFYNDGLLPLRLSKASERLDPPLVDILVTDGYRKGKTNPPEADCIVAELKVIANDQNLAGRTVGVTTLLGTEQAALIYKNISDELGIDFIERFSVRVGDPTVFQGDERDIMFLSLVAAPGDASTLSGLAYEQRFNVAASRARERMILVRSIEIAQLSPNDALRRALLEHFSSPFPHDLLAAAAVRERCESDFERDMFDMLTARGFRVDTQVRIGAYRIDMVVEGEDDRRLAIECDGDRYHGPQQWTHDMQRQRTLERAGWTVWRCFASRYVRDRNDVIDELIEELQSLHISPTRDGVRSTAYTEFRRWSSGEFAPMSDSDTSLDEDAMASRVG